MIEDTLSAAAAVMEADADAPDGTFRGVSIDSRTVPAGALFFAIEGERFDGHDFVAGALSAGAAAAVVAQGRVRAGTLAAAERARLIEVADPRRALGLLGRSWRRRCPARIAGITGSNGKTTVKEMLAAILRRDHAITATRGNLNNDLGVPLTLCEIGVDDAYAVIEMGTNYPGEIGYLARLAEPDVALVNNCSAAHLQGLATVEGVAREKGAIYDGLAARGVAVINADQTFAPMFRERAGAHRCVEFSTAAEAEVWVRAREPAPDLVGSLIELVLGGDVVSVALPLPGDHNVANAAAAAACAYALGLGPDVVKAGLERARGVPGRLELRRGRSGSWLIDDSYNANPASLRAALAYLARRPERRWLVLADMGELGDNAERWHREAGERAADAGVERLFTFGPLAALAAETFTGETRHCGTLDDLSQAVNEDLGQGVCVLVKGSRSNHLERVVAAMQAETTPC